MCVACVFVWEYTFAYARPIFKDMFLKNPYLSPFTKNELATYMRFYT